MSRPLLLDLYCGVGLAADGYIAAGFDVIGVDITDHPEYPGRFVRADLAVENLADLVDLSTIAAAHGSPPCQAHTTMSNRDRGHRSAVANDHLDLIPRTYEMLDALDVPWVVENVAGARSALRDPVTTLSGGMFGLGVYRPRLFSTSFPIVQPPKVGPPEGHVGVYGKLDGRRLWKRNDGTELRAPRTLEQGLKAMGVDRHVEWHDLTEGFPPAYTEWIGHRLMEVLP